MNMSNNYTTIYQICRQTAGMTQEHAAELLGVATRTLAAWESGERPVPDLRVADMVDLYGTPFLALQHLRLYSPLGPKVLPPVDRVPLPQAVCQLFKATADIEKARVKDQLIQIAADGRVDELEETEFSALLLELEPLISAVLALKYAEEV